MDNQPINFETYAQTLSQTMADAVAAAEALQAEAVADREAAFADQDALRDLLRTLENKAQRAVEDDASAMSKRIKKEMIAQLATRLENTPEEVEKILGLVRA